MCYSGARRSRRGHHIAGPFTAQRIGPTRTKGEGLNERRPVAAPNTDPNRYRSYLLRLWRDASGAPWRCQVQCVGTRRERRFAGLAEMVEFLLADAAGDVEKTGGQEDRVPR